MKRVFISFDFDHDNDIRNALVGQSEHPNSPFKIADASLRRHLNGDWEKQVQNRIKRADLVAVMCGEHTHEAEGVAAEVKIAQEEGKPYFLLKGRRDKRCMKPKTALDSDEIHEWTWDNLSKQIEGETLSESAQERLNTPIPGSDTFAGRRPLSAQYQRALEDINRQIVRKEAEKAQKRAARAPRRRKPKLDGKVNRVRLPRVNITFKR